MPPRKGVRCATCVTTWPQACASLAALVWCAACGVDDRALAPMQGATGGAGGSGSGSAAGRAPITRPGDSSAEDGGQAPTLPVCDYSGEVSAECASLVQNAGFAQDTEGWDQDGGVYGLWRDADAKDAKNSGSMDVLNTLTGDDGGVAPGAARQCLPASPGTTFDLAGDVYIEEGQGDGKMPGGPYVGKAVLGGFFFDDEACQGTSVGFFNAKEVSDTGQWVHVTTSGTAPDLTKAVLVRLNALKPIRQSLFKATFDNVLVREREP